ncbi:ABC transporter substrate-binding protein [Alicyclobacillus tengchongensis]|nr:ABC transporter substrate-binding protein [Alicyclobacillus tengchongensis]
MKKWQIVTTGVAAFALAGGVLAGCGTNSGTNTANAANTSTGQADTGAASTLPKGQTITVWSWAGGPQLTDVKKIAQAWAKQHGDSVNVVDQSSNPKGFQFYATAARTGKGPDVVFGMPHDNNGTFAEEGLMASVPNSIINTKAYAANTLDAVKVNGTMYSVPVSVQVAALYYNKKLVPQAPTTWAAFVKDANAHGFMYDQANLYFDYALIGGMGGYVFKDTNGTLNPNDIGLDNSGSVKAYALMHDMDSKYKWMTPSVNGSIAKAQFLAGKIGMYVSGPWDTGDIEKAKIDYGITPWPTLPNGKPATPFLGVITAFVNKESKTQPADWSLVQALTNASAQKTYFSDSQQIPALVSVQKSPAVQNNPAFKAFTAALKNSVPMPNIPQMQAVWTADTILQNIIAGKVSPQQGGKDFVQNIQKGILAQG